MNNQGTKLSEAEIQLQVEKCKEAVRQRDLLLKAAKAALRAMDGLNNGGFGPLTLKSDIDAMLELEAAIDNVTNNS
jgi:hypothetical protein